MKRSVELCKGPESEVDTMSRTGRQGGVTPDASGVSGAPSLHRTSQISEGKEHKRTVPPEGL